MSHETRNRSQKISVLYRTRIFSCGKRERPSGRPYWLTELLNDCLLSGDSSSVYIAKRGGSGTLSAWEQRGKPGSVLTLWNFRERTT